MRFKYSVSGRRLQKAGKRRVVVSVLASVKPVVVVTKGQKSRSGGGVRRGFEGGQMPLYRRLPKFGFTSRKAAITAEVRLSDG